MGFLTRKDSTLYRCFFKEMAKLRGIEVEYRYAVKTDTTIYAEFQSEYSEPIVMDIIFQENPKVNTLKRIGWVSENPDDKPYIAMLPFDAKNLDTDSIIDIPPVDVVREKPRRFRINRITTLMEYPDCWVCIVAPVFNNDEVRDDTTKNYNYMKTNYSIIDGEER